VSSFAFLVHHRSVDLTAMSAAHALRHDLGLGDDLIGLRRDDVTAIEPAGGDPVEWSRACAATAHWFNPNKHRFAFFTAEAGALAGLEHGRDFPRPWLKRILFSDRPDLDVSNGPIGFSAWSQWSSRPPVHVVTLASWDRETGLSPLPHGAWPERTRRARLQLWTLALRAATGEVARAVATDCAVATQRDQGLLVNPHMEGWTMLGDLTTSPGSLQ
jgi:hypothetical protein